ncbi:MAG: hypothetical protein C0621_06135 [Desulfuromonas sp.]|nr:MAG: hypothetical protein C0621_06135 [Desulfuromonas sp.]
MPTISLTLGKKLFLYTGALLTGLLLFTFVVMERNQSRQWEAYHQEQSFAFARFATPELLKLFRGHFPPRDGHSEHEIYDFIGFNRDLIRFSVLSPGGRTMFTSRHFPDHIDVELDAIPDWPASDIIREMHWTVRSFSGGDRLLDLVTPAYGPTGEQILAVRYLISYNAVDARLDEVRDNFLRIAVVSITLSLILAAIVARFVTGPIKELTLGARAIARDNLGTRINVHSSDEIGMLARAFNEMASSLSASRDELTYNNEALQKANDDLKTMQEHLIRSERLAAIGQLAAGVSHEIDNPVGIILGYAELLLEDTPPPDPRRDDLLAIIDECKRCRRITGGLLDFSRSSAPCRRAVAVDELLESTLTALRPQKIFKNLTLTLEAEGGLPHLIADADQLRQILVNLLLNAAQILAGQGEILLRCYRKDDLLEIACEDTGPGIPDALQEKIFEPFFSTKARGEGTGLGLSICRRLVEEHGGTLCAATSERGGGLFILSLPLGGEEKSFDIDTDNSLG